MNFLSPENLLSLLIGALLGFFVNLLLKRPKLKRNGSGGGGGPGPGFHEFHVDIRNEPGLFGIRFGETKIFGLVLWRSFAWGFAFDRSPAVECRAMLYDKKTRTVVGQLLWDDPENPEKKLSLVTLPCGKSSKLNLFARLENEPTRYFHYQTDDLNTGLLRNPSQEAKFDDSREFYVEITYAYRTQKLRFAVSVIKGFDGRLSYKLGKYGSGSF